MSASVAGKRRVFWLASAVAQLTLLAAALWGDEAANAIGASGAGCREQPLKVDRLSIKSPGTYENMLVDGNWGGSTLVKITADDVVLKNCEIKNGKHNAVLVAGKNITIDSCQIHHALAGTFKDQKDAHGITGHPTKLVIRNCEIGMVSGDAIQFDPGRGAWDEVLVENCTFYTAPLEVDAAGFKRCERPGENGIDTKQRTSNSRSRLTVRNCVFRGWRQPGQVRNLAAMNLKNHVDVKVENCVFRDNEICLRLRGGEGDYGGALVTVERCAFYDSETAVRAEDNIRDLKLRQLGFGPGLKRPLQAVGVSGIRIPDQFEPPTFDQAIKAGLRKE